MQISSRVKQLQESITLKLNEQVNELVSQGKTIYNLTAGQLPFHPPDLLVKALEEELKFLKSFQYAPVPGFPQLRNKVLTHLENSRQIVLSNSSADFECVVATGAKQIIFNALGALLDPGDEVIILAPYWISYPEMISFWGGKPVIVESDQIHHFTPEPSAVAAKISKKTKAIIINSPNNPVGHHYPREWMVEMAEILSAHPDVTILSDEIYYDLCYFDPKPTYVYQHNPSLLSRTLIIEGISKAMAATGLRIGYGVGPKNLVRAISKLQGQSTSSANSLVQQALIQYDWKQNQQFLQQVCEHLRKNARVIKEELCQGPLKRFWYQTSSAFYFLIDFTKAPFFSHYGSVDTQQDYSMRICEDLLNRYGVAIVPGGDFGVINSGRLSLVANVEDFNEAIKRIRTFLLEN